MNRHSSEEETTRENMNLFSWHDKIKSYIFVIINEKQLKNNNTQKNFMCRLCSVIDETVNFRLVFNWNHFEMRLLNPRINFYLLRIFCPHLGSFYSFIYLFIYLCCFFFHYVSAKFHLWPSSGNLPRPRIGMLSLVTVSPVITAFHSCCVSHHVFDHWPAWVGFETAIFWYLQCSPGTVETQCLYPLRHGPRRMDFWVL